MVKMVIQVALFKEDSRKELENKFNETLKYFEQTGGMTPIKIEFQHETLLTKELWTGMLTYRDKNK